MQLRTTRSTRRTHEPIDGPKLHVFGTSEIEREHMFEENISVNDTKQSFKEKKKMK